MCLCVCVCFINMYMVRWKNKWNNKYRWNIVNIKIFCITDTEDVSALMPVIWAKELVFERMVDLVKPGVDVFVRSIDWCHRGDFERTLKCISEACCSPWIYASHLWVGFIKASCSGSGTHLLFMIFSWQQMTYFKLLLYIFLMGLFLWAWCDSQSPYVEDDFFILSFAFLLFTSGQHVEWMK